MVIVYKQRSSKEICYYAKERSDLSTSSTIQQKCLICRYWYTWKVQGTGCPNCRVRDCKIKKIRNPAPTKSTTSPTIEDGIYVDVSESKEKMTLGIVRIRNGKVIYRDWFPRPDLKTKTTEAEKAAIILAKFLFPGEKVFCDNYKAAIDLGVVHIDRKFNKAAHRTARNRHQLNVKAIGPNAVTNYHNL